MKDLATAFVKVLGNKAATKQVYNISGERYVTFDGIAKACALAAGAPEPELIHFDPKAVDLGKAKAFPLRDQHFFTSIEKVLYFEKKPQLVQTFCILHQRSSCEARKTRACFCTDFEASCFRPQQTVRFPFILRSFKKPCFCMQMRMYSEDY